MAFSRGIGNFGVRGPRSAASAVLWTPLELASIQDLYDGDYKAYTDDGTTLADDTDPVKRWVNRVNESQYLEQTTLGLRPLYGIGANGVGYLESDGTDDIMTRSFGGTVSQPTTVFLCAAPLRDATGINNVIFDGDSARQIIYGANGTPGVWAYFAGSLTNSTESFDVGEWKRVIAVFDGASSKLFINGVQVANGAPGSNGIDRFTLFSGFDGTAGANVQLSVAGLCTAAISGSDLTRLDAYMLRKVPT